MKRPLTYARRWQVVPGPKILQRLQSTYATRPLRKPSAAYFSVPTLANDTKDDILGALRKDLRQHPQSTHSRAGQVPGAVVCATPRHASWLNDADFMAAVVRELRARRQYTDPAMTKFHVLAAVVDGLPPVVQPGTVQEGMSFLSDDATDFLPGLWDNTSESLPDTVSSSLCFSRKFPTVRLNHTVIYSEQKDHHLTLPLANTLFLNGRRSTLLVSEWTVTDDDATQEHPPRMELSRMATKATQVIKIRAPGTQRTRLSIAGRLAPICPPRIIKGVLGNIISEIEIEGKPSPASAELQQGIPRFLEQRIIQDPTASQPSGPVSVWALVTPRSLVPPRTSKPEKQTVRSHGGLVRYAAHTPSLVGQDTHAPGDFLTTLLPLGSRLHRVLSGGGEWGAKAGLLSLNPDIEYGSPSEAESLESFQSSFRGDTKAADAIASPGDSIQFFVRDAQEDTDGKRAVSSKNWLLQLGAGDASGESELREKELVQYREETGSRIQPYFGGYSTEGFYMSVPETGVKTKVDVPGSSFVMRLT